MINVTDSPLARSPTFNPPNPNCCNSGRTSSLTSLTSASIRIPGIRIPSPSSWNENTNIDGYANIWVFVVSARLVEAENLSSLRSNAHKVIRKILLLFELSLHLNWAMPISLPTYQLFAYNSLLTPWYSCQARIQEFTLVGAPWIGEGSRDGQGPQRVQGSARWGGPGGRSPREAHEN